MSKELYLGYLEEVSRRCKLLERTSNFHEFCTEEFQYEK
jgi:hypothetical protein